MLPAGFPSHVLRLLAFFLLPDGFFTPTAAKETPSTAVLRATAAGWSYSLSSPLPPQLATLQERHWRALLREVHRLDCGLVLAPWLDLFVHLLFVLALGLIVVWKPLLKELEVSGTGRCTSPDAYLNTLSRTASFLPPSLPRVRIRTHSKWRGGASHAQQSHPQ
eukprot:scaffold6792_cov35-Tisochrysis_lutea.AAC.8